MEIFWIHVNDAKWIWKMFRLFFHISTWNYINLIIENNVSNMQTDGIELNKNDQI